MVQIHTSGEAIRAGSDSVQGGFGRDDFVGTFCIQGSWRNFHPRKIQGRHQGSDVRLVCRRLTKAAKKHESRAHDGAHFSETLVSWAMGFFAMQTSEQPLCDVNVTFRWLTTHVEIPDQSTTALPKT